MWHRKSDCVHFKENWSHLMCGRGVSHPPQPRILVEVNWNCRDDVSASITRWYGVRIPLEVIPPHLSLPRGANDIPTAHCSVPLGPDRDRKLAHYHTVRSGMSRNTYVSSGLPPSFRKDASTPQRSSQDETPLNQTDGEVHFQKELVSRTAPVKCRLNAFSSMARDYAIRPFSRDLLRSGNCRSSEGLGGLNA